MFFRRPPPPAPELTSDGYRRWLRAQRPPLQWFLALPEIEQETLAMLGDEHAQDVAIAIGYAVADPRAADAGVSAAAGDTEAEASLAMRMAKQILSQIAPPASAVQPSAPGRGSMSGIGERRKAVQSRHAAPSVDLFPGVKPDHVTVPVGDEVLSP